MGRFFGFLVVIGLVSIMLALAVDNIHLTPSMLIAVLFGAGIIAWIFRKVEGN